MTWREMPCLKPEGLAVFSHTPEQRVMLGEQYFNATHTPMWMRKRVAGGEALLGDQDLLRQLCAQERVTGNRVIILYGAAGSGKSELMTWLQQALLKAVPERPVIRIARTDLDTLGILNRMHHLLTGTYFADATLRRWDDMRAKPRTLSKLLVLRALEKLYQSDDIINQLFFRLLDAVEPLVERILAHDSRQAAQDILDHEYMEGLVTQGVLPEALDIGAFRQHLFDGFSELMLEQLNIRETLRSLSTHFEGLGQRPVVLFDDLVQSINVFASEFLDYFITLDEGNWDALIGITPGSLETDIRGRELVRRIENLDTIDDRVDKLWLSDESGLESFFLNEANAAAFAANYMNAFRRLNHMECADCPHLAACTSLQHQDSQLLAPLNEASVARVFQGLPTYKGKVRAFVRALLYIIEGCVDGERPDVRLPRIASSSLYVESEHIPVRDVIKYYGHESLSPDVFPRLLDFFEVSVPDTMPYCATLEQSPLPISGASMRVDVGVPNEPAMMAVREWLEGKETNRELLQRLRKGASMWLRTAHPPVATGIFHYPHAARPHGVLRDHLMEMGVSPPVALEDVDLFAGIAVSRTIGRLAFQFMLLTDSNPSVRKAALNAVANDPRATEILWKSQEWNRHRQFVLELQVGLTPDYLAFAAFILCWIINGTPPLIPPGFGEIRIQTLNELHDVVRLFVPRLPTTTDTLINQWFEDFFKLRDNVYDHRRIGSHLISGDHLFVLSSIARLPEQGIDERFELGGLSLIHIVRLLRQRATQVMSALATHNTSPVMRLSGQGRELMGRLQRGEHVPLTDVSTDDLREISEKTPEAYRRLRVSHAQPADEAIVHHTRGQEEQIHE